MKVAAILLSLSLAAHAGSSEPGAAAVEFLEKVRSGQINLTPGGDTALSPQTREEKREEIGERLGRIADELGTAPLEVAAVKEDDGFAAVLVRTGSGFDPADARVFAVALVKRGADWLAAPVPASFENVGSGQVIAIRKRLEALENWMLREQVLDLQKLQDRSGSLIREKIEAGFSINRLKELDEKEAGDAFLTACSERNLPMALALLGGLSTSPPDDWSARLKAANTAFLSPTAKSPWQPLVSPRAVRVAAHRGKGELVIASLTPIRRERGTIIPGIATVHLTLTRDPEGLWRVDLPDSLLTGKADETDTEESGLSKWTPEFPAAFSASRSASFPQNAIAAWDEFRDAMDGNDPARALATADLFGSKPAALRNCVDAVSVWHTVHDETEVRHLLPLAFKAEDHLAVGLIQILSARTPEKEDFRTVYFTKSSRGWLWSPNPTADVKKEFRDWSTAAQAEWSGKWRETLFFRNPVVSKDDFRNTPSDEEVRQCMERWFSAVRRSDLDTAMENVALLSTPDSSASALRNIGYEISSARSPVHEPEVIGIHRDGPITAVAVKVRNRDKIDYPLFPIVKTSAGTRILIEIDLIVSPTRGFLNKTALEQLEKSEGHEIAGKFRELFAAHSERVASATPAGQEK